MDDVTKTAPKAKAKAANPVITEIVRNGLVAVTEEMKINLMRTAYNMIIYEALDFTVGLFDARGNIVSIGLGLPMFIRGMSETVKAKLEHYGVGEHRSGRRPAHQRRLHHRLAPQPHDLHGADLPRGRAGRLLVLHGALAGRRRHHHGGHDRHLLRRPADADREDLSQGRAERGADRPDQDERAPARARDGRFPRPARRGEDRRAALRSRWSANTAATTCWAASTRSWTRARRWRAPASRTCRTASTRPSRSWTTTASTSASACRSSVRVDDRGREDDRRPHRRLAAGAGLLQLRQDRGLLLRPGGVQVPDLGARPADQRGPVPRARHRAAAGPRGERDEARGDADVDDLSDDHRRHDLQGAGAGAARPGDRRPPRRPLRRPHQRPAAEGRQLLHLSRRADRRRLGRQVQQRRPQRRDRA